MAKKSGGRVECDLAPNDVLAIDMCGPFTPSLGGNLYTFYGVDHQLRLPSQIRGVGGVQALCGGHGAQGGNGGEVCPGRLRRPLD